MARIELYFHKSLKLFFSLIFKKKNSKVNIFGIPCKVLLICILLLLIFHLTNDAQLYFYCIL
jgi:hypothetical protein